MSQRSSTHYAYVITPNNSSTQNGYICSLADRISLRQLCKLYKALGPPWLPHHILLLTGRPVAFRHGRPSPQLPLFSLAIPPLPPRWRNSPHAKTNWFYLPLVLWGHILIWLIGCHCSSAVWECWLYFHILQGGSGFWRSLGKQGWKVNWISFSETLLFLQDVVWYMLDVFLKWLTEWSGGRASIVKNAFLSFLQFSFFQCIHFISIQLSSIFCLSIYPFSVRKNLNIWRFPIKRGPFATLGIRHAQKWPFDLSQ